MIFLVLYVSKIHKKLTKFASQGFESKLLMMETVDEGW